MRPTFMYIIALNAMKYTMILRYTPAMTAPKKEHQEKIADFRNSIADVIERARYFDETTVLTSRGKRVAVVVGMDFYERAIEALGEQRVPADPKAQRDVGAARTIAES